MALAAFRHIGDAEPEHGGVAEPERQAGNEAELGDLDGVEPPGRVHAVAHRAAGEDAGADIVADRIAGEPAERGDAVRHVMAADRAQREEIVERQREIAEGDEQRGEQDVARVGPAKRLQDIFRFDAVQGLEQHKDRDRDDRETDRDADPAPADLLIAKPIGQMRGVDHALQAFRRIRLARLIHRVQDGMDMVFRVSGPPLRPSKSRMRWRAPPPAWHSYFSSPSRKNARSSV